MDLKLRSWVDVDIDVDVEVNIMKKKHVFIKSMVLMSSTGLLVYTNVVMAAGTQTIGAMASAITDSFETLAKLITAGAYLGGLGYSVGSIMKFKQHKDNPQQVQIGVPISLLFIGAALLFLPSILGIAGETMFGKSGSVAGPKGSAWTN